MPKKIHIPKQKKEDCNKISPQNITENTEDKKVVFSFETLERNEYFNLDGTCVRWSSDLFETIKKVSKITMREIHAGKYSGKTSPFRIHRHNNAKPPCEVPNNILLDELWQIRISVSKGGIHGLFIDNIFYVLWLDPQHNLYPDKNHGGLVKIASTSTCCKERDQYILELERQLETEKNTNHTLLQYIEAAGLKQPNTNT